MTSAFVPGPVFPGATPNTQELKWTISNLSYIDEDTGYEYLEVTNTLKMPILSTDEITFHVEFYKDSTAPTEGLFRDGFEC